MTLRVSIHGCPIHPATIILHLIQHLLDLITSFGVPTQTRIMTIQYTMIHMTDTKSNSIQLTINPPESPPPAKKFKLIADQDYHSSYESYISHMPPAFDVADSNGPETKLNLYWYHAKSNKQPPATLMFNNDAHYCRLEVAFLNEEILLPVDHHCYTLLQGLYDTYKNLSSYNEPSIFDINQTEAHSLNQLNLTFLFNTIHLFSVGPVKNSVSLSCHLASTNTINSSWVSNVLLTLNNRSFRRYYVILTTLVSILMAYVHFQ